MMQRINGQHQRPDSVPARAGHAADPGAQQAAGADLVELGRRLEHHRTARTTLTIAQLCKRTGYHRSNYNRLIGRQPWPRGTPSRPHQWTLLLLADALGLTSEQRDELFALAGYDPGQLPRSVKAPPWSPQADLGGLSDEDLAYYAGLIQGERNARRRAAHRRPGSQRET